VARSQLSTFVTATATRKAPSHICLALPLSLYLVSLVLSLEPSSKAAVTGGMQMHETSRNFHHFVGAFLMLENRSWTLAGAPDYSLGVLKAS